MNTEGYDTLNRLNKLYNLLTLADLRLASHLDSSTFMQQVFSPRDEITRAARRRVIYSILKELERLQIECIGSLIKK